MPEADHTNGSGNGGRKERWPEAASRFQLVVVATLRAKQLVRGARPRIEASSQRHRNTSIALEEVRRGLVSFTCTNADREKNGGGSEHA